MIQQIEPDKIIELPIYGIKICLTGDCGVLESNLHEPDGTDTFNAAMDAIEAFVVALAHTRQYDLTSPAFLEALETAVDACANKML